jgi:hypothetical protein
MPLSNARELKEDVLFRASESLTGSAWNGKVMDYLNRVYRTLATGASEFLPEFVDDWWWMRASGTLMIEPAYVAGTVVVTQGSASITFNPAPSVDLTGRRLKIIGFPDLFVIQTHAEDDPIATLDYPYTGDDNVTATFQAMRTEYTIDGAAQVLTSPMIAFRDPHRINGLTPEKMDELYPLALLQPGVPHAFCPEDETTIRFSHGGRDDGRTVRIEYRYRPTVEDLTDSMSSIPLVPPQWMHVLGDMALVYVMLDKNDDRSNAAALGARTGLAAMLKENRRRLTKIDHLSGQIVPRPGGLGMAPGPRMGRI